MTISASAGSGKPVNGPFTTSMGSPRILTADDGKFAALPALKIFVPVNSAVLAFGDLAPDGFLVVDFAAIGAEIIPFGVGVFGNAHVGGAAVAVGGQ